MTFGLIFSKYFAMTEFPDVNQWCKYFDEIKKAGIQRYFISGLFKMQPIFENYV